MKKRLIRFLVLLVVFIPFNAKANITCNDGTISKTCGDCHRGCCSRHGGCTDNPNSGSYSLSESNTTKTTTKPVEKAKNSKDDSDDFFTKLLLFVGGAVAGGIGISYIKKKE